MSTPPAGGGSSSSSSITTTSNTSPPRKLRLLLLHGYTQSGPLFRAKTRALEKALAKQFPPAPRPGHLPSHPAGLEFHYITGPVRLRAAEIPTFDGGVTSTSTSLSRGEDGAEDDDGGDGRRRGGGAGVGDVLGGEEVEAYAWWRKRTVGAEGEGEGGGEAGKVVYDGWEQSCELWARTLRDQGPFDGVVGFSQGGAAAVMLAALLEEGRRARFEGPDAGGMMAWPVAFEGLRHPAFRFVVVYSGFRAPAGSRYDAIYEGGLSTPSLHFIGSVDTVVEESRSLAVLEACRGGKGQEAEERHRLVYHPGGHFVPSSQKPSVNAVAQFIRDVVGDASRGAAEKKEEEESVEDMDMPF